MAFHSETPRDILGEQIAAAGLTQLRIAETEKYAHVTYFFNGGVETPFPGEDRVLIPSPRDVATYDHKPEMSAIAVTDELLRRLAGDDFAFILLNFANPDMVGHTGVMAAAIKAVETVDRGLERICEAVLARGGDVLITADHGNCEQMVDRETGPAPHRPHHQPGAADLGREAPRRPPPARRRPLGSRPDRARADGPADPRGDDREGPHRTAG